MSLASKANKNNWFNQELDIRKNKEWTIYIDLIFKIRIESEQRTGNKYL